MNGKVVGVVVAAVLILVAAVAVAGLGLYGGDGGDGEETVTGEASAIAPTAPTDAGSTPSSPSPTAVDEPPAYQPDDPTLDVARSRPREDSYYPDRGDRGVDSLHYDLDLAWDPGSSTLSGVADLAFRATADAEEVRLDLLDALEVSAVTLDGEPAPYTQSHKHLVVRASVRADERYGLHVEYAGTPRPVPAPTTRSDFGSVGMNVTPDGELWTMQEPFGAHTWYPVNDQPADKALYDFTVRAPREWVGVANGVLESRTVEDGRTVTRWTLARPASAYLTTLAVGDLVETTTESASGVPISFWTPRDDPDVLRDLRVTPSALAWAQKRLGPYPFDSLGIVVVDSFSGMETQTMITLGGIDPYTTSPEVILHEIVHQWYGDLVSPTDWRDVWMNEGMTMFLQGAYQADRSGLTVDQVMDQWAAAEEQFRVRSGPPGAYDRGEFGEGNIYYGPALMWNELRKDLGPRAFWSMVRAWPSVYADGNATRRQYYRWLERQTGRELSDFLDAWIVGETTPPRS